MAGAGSGVLGGSDDPVTQNHGCIDDGTVGTLGTAMNIEEVAAALIDRKLTLAVAEASTGGLIAAELTRRPGSSAYFRGGIVPYDDLSKVEILGAPAAVFVEHGSVSGEACLAMAKAVRGLFRADIGLAETSIAGPAGGSPRKPAGLSYVAVDSTRGSAVREHHFDGRREQNRQAAVEAALTLLRVALC